MAYMDYTTADPRNNELLAALPSDELQRWLPHLELVAMPAGMSLYHAGEHPKHVYFPTTACVSIQHLTMAGACGEIAAIGRDGMVGVQIIMGGGSTSGNAVVRAGGHGLRMSSTHMQAEFSRSEAVMRLLLLYVQALMTQTAQTALCSLQHCLEQRLCRCLLTSLDRTRGPKLTITHECLASLLGVRREGVTTAAFKLQRAGVIEYARGQMVVLDRAGLEDRSCECYGVVKDEYQRLLPQRPNLQKSVPTLPEPVWPNGRPFIPAPLLASGARNPVQHTRMAG